MAYNRPAELLPSARMMRLEVIFQNADDQVTSAFQTKLNPLALIVAGERKEEEMLARGEKWATGAIPALTNVLAEATKRSDAKGAEVAAMQVAMAAWLLDSLYAGVTADAFVNSDLRFTVSPSGAVRYDRIPGADDSP